MNQIGVVMNLKDLGIPNDMPMGIADVPFQMEDGYKVFLHDKIV